MKKRKGFTLVELVIVIAIIAILASVLIPTFAGILERARESARLQRATNARNEFLSGSELSSVSEMQGYIICVDNNFYIISENGELLLDNTVDVSNFKELTTTSNNSVIYVIDNQKPAGVYYTNAFNEAQSVLYEDDFEKWLNDVNLAIGTSFSLSGNEGDYTLLNEGDGNCDYEWTGLNVNIIFPDNVGITTINYWAFGMCQNLIEITFPEGLKTIKYCVFEHCENLKKVTLPSTLEIIEESAFYRTGIEEVVFNNNNSLIILGTHAFADCTNLKKINIPSSVEIIDTGAFDYCSNLKDITLPESLEEINSYAFRNCDSLENIYLPAKVKYIEADAFCECSGIKSIIVDNDNTCYDSRNNCNAIINTESKTLISGCFNSTIPYGVEIIGSYSFNGVEKLKELIIPETVTSIGNYSFSGCKSLLELEIPGNVKTLNFNAFSFCYKLTKLTLNEGIETISSNTFSSCINLLSVTIPSSVTTLDKNAFSYCSKLVQIRNLTDNLLTLTSNVGQEIKTDNTNFSGIITYGEKYITYNYAAEIYLMGVTDYTITKIDDMPANITALYKNALTYCENLITVDVASGVKILGEYAFNSLKNLEKVYIPNTVTAIGEYCFSYCSNLKNIYFEENSILTRFEQSTFRGCALTELSIPSSVTSIGAWSFSYNKFEQIEIPSNVTTIETYAFGFCATAKRLIVPESVTTIGANAFTSCQRVLQVRNLSGLTLQGLPTNSYRETIIDDSEFTSIVEVGEKYVTYRYEDINYLVGFVDSSTIYADDIPEDIIVIMDSAFRYSSSLKTVVIPKNVTTIGANAFEGTNITSIKIPNSVTKISKNAFTYSNLLAVEFENTTGWTVDSLVMDVSNVETNATNLSTNSTYYSKDWIRE